MDLRTNSLDELRKWSSDSWPAAGERLLIREEPSSGIKERTQNETAYGIRNMHPDGREKSMLM